jgi:3-dehydroquinate synthase
MQFDESFQLPLEHRVIFCAGLLDPSTAVLRSVLADCGARRAIAFIDAGVESAHPQGARALQNWFSEQAAAGHTLPDLCSVDIVRGGEAAKNDSVIVDQVIAATERHSIDRRSFVIAIGGGAMLDAVGLGATLAHRGVRLVRVPTTTLAMDDAAMGVKNGINRFGKKNYVGAFAVPWAVLCDETYLTTLNGRDFRAGFSEAVKIACLRDASLLAQMERDAARIAAQDIRVSMPTIIRCAQLHLEHITRGGDPFELKEARPLDFGHWSAHKLESMSGFTLPHGEAVSIGIALDCAYAHRIGLLAAEDATRITACLRALHLPTWHPLLEDIDVLLRGLEEFREHLGGVLTITQLTAIGQPIDVHEMDALAIRAAVRSLAP